MAWNFGAQINSLTQFDGNTETASEEGENFTTLANQWLTDAAKEVFNLLPFKLKEKCLTDTILTNSPTNMDLDGVGQIISVRRKNSDSGYFIECRKLEQGQIGLVTDPSSLYYASVNDPVYYISSQSDVTSLYVIPTPTANQTAIVAHMGFPTVDHAHSSIDNFPDEAEYLVVLRAAITATQYKLNFEEDVELYAPILSTLKAQYQEGIQALISGNIAQKQQQGAK